jgi:hypothetical protein
VGKPRLAGEVPGVVAVASDEAVDGDGLPVLDLNDVQAIADFILAQTGLAPGGGVRQAGQGG